MTKNHDITRPDLSAIPEEKLRFLHLFLESLSEDILYEAQRKLQRDPRSQNEVLGDADLLTLLVGYFKGDSQKDHYTYQFIKATEPFYAMESRAEIEARIHDVNMNTRLTPHGRACMVRFANMIALSHAKGEDALEPPHAITDGNKNRFAVSLLNKRRAWLDQHIEDDELRVQISMSEMDYTMGLKALETGEFAMDSLLHLKVIFDRLQLHGLYAKAGFTPERIGQTFKELHAVHAEIISGLGGNSSFRAQ